MSDRTLVRTGAIGAVIAAICCATPVLAVILPALGLGAWLAKADYLLFPLLFVFLAVLVLGLYRRRAMAAACRETGTPKESTKS